MRIAENWKDYELIDATDGERLERWDKYYLVRPDPQVIWKSERRSDFWKRADAVYHRSSSGGGHWEYRKKLPQEWKIGWKDLSFIVSPTSFKHTGVFPEQAANWQLYIDMISGKKDIKVLNMFGYTGAATVACLSAGASVCHVDASKGIVQKAKQNVILNGLEKEKIRYIVDDCVKFVKREIRRGSRYDGIIMDPPSYGRGPSGEIWKIEDSIYDLIETCKEVLTDEPLFFALNSYTTGLSASTMGYVLSDVLRSYGGKCSSDEIGINVTSTDLPLPCGSTSIYRFRD